MAFRHPMQVQRQPSLSTPAQPDTPAFHQSQYQQPLDQSQSWVLFSPSQAASSTARTSTDRTPRTAGLSRLSDFGSLETAARSTGEDDEEDLSDGALDEEEEDEELDSLDEGLQAFRENDATILPTHNGLGTFASSAQMQEQLWQYEEFNPKRKFEGRHHHERRRSSIQRRLDTVEELDAQTAEDAKRQRIEDWRMEQSRALLREIEKETRRLRRNSRASNATNSSQVTEGVPDISILASQASGGGGTTAQPAEETGEDESFWRRVTRKVIRDLIGIDDTLLSVIFGEQLPEDAAPPRESLSNTTEQGRSGNEDDTWQDRLLERVARELGILVHQLCEHPGAFSTYLRSTTPTEYAGMPVSRPPLARQTSPKNSRSSNNINSINNLKTADQSSNIASSTYTPTFHPTLQEPEGASSSHDALWGIEEEGTNTPTANEESERLRRDREYWERELDIGMVFSFLRNRFARGRCQSHNTATTNPATNASASNSSNFDPGRRAAIIRQHHPLIVARGTMRERQNQKRRSIGSPSMHTLSIKRQGSSCASHSNKRSGSSRNYWDIGGSVGSGSVVGGATAAATGGLGAWGEV